MKLYAAAIGAIAIFLVAGSSYAASAESFDPSERQLFKLSPNQEIYEITKYPCSPGTELGLVAILDCENYQNKNTHNCTTGYSCGNVKVRMFKADGESVETTYLPNFCCSQNTKSQKFTGYRKKDDGKLHFRVRNTECQELTIVVGISKGKCKP